MKNYVITIARGFGSGGKEIASKLSKELGIPCYDRQLLTMASDESGIEEDLFVEADEKLRGKYISNKLRKIPFTTVLEPHEKDFVSDINLFNIQAKIIRDLANTESCIIVGKCADHILKDFKNVLSIYVEAPRASCVKSVMNKMFTTADKAEHLIKRTDKYRSKYYSYYTGGKDWTNPINYDMILNSQRIGRDKCVEIVKEVVGIKF